MLTFVKATKPIKIKQPTTMKLTAEDLKVIRDLRAKYNWQGLNNPQTVRVAIRRLAEQADSRVVA